ncbi:MAG: hypothetical protein GX100_09845 [candidate division WS1 bacterium]|nr:hypothetical protein [candidate division WS1 bacterium]
MVELRKGAESPWDHLRCLTHELSSALTTVRIAGDTLGSPDADEPGFRQVYAALIAEECGHITRLMADFAEVLRPGWCLVPGEEEKADLNEAAHQAAMELTGLAAQVHDRILVIPAREGTGVAGSQEKITQALRGFMEYLLGVVPAGTTVKVEVCPEEPRSGGPGVTFSALYPDRATSPPCHIVLDWSRIHLAAARYIVEQHGGEVRSGGEEEGEEVFLLSATWPHLEVSAHTVLFQQHGVRQASLPEVECNPEVKAA